MALYMLPQNLSHVAPVVVCQRIDDQRSEYKYAGVLYMCLSDLNSGIYLSLSTS